MPRLPSGEVHVWRAWLDVPATSSARLYPLLSTDERRRSAHFRFERDRQRFVVAHGVLRELLGRYLRTPPEEIAYAHNACGKPELCPEFGGRLAFNLSHSAGLALIAIAADACAGIDLEYVRAQSDYAEIARRFFSAEEARHLGALPEELYAEAFIACWTKKEAYIKARGGGLSIPLNGFSIPLTTDPARGPDHVRVASNEPVPARLWSFHTLRPAPGYIGALAIEGRGWRLRRLRYSAIGR